MWSEKMTIRLLDTDTINKIAAGEVVERPASAVKELVENSLDSGARNITVRIERGGKRLIEVEDDGCGMSADDARLAFKEHATSKLGGIDDLLSLETFGFRGEALASIGSVAICELWTVNGEDGVGTYLRVEDSAIVKDRSMAGPPGTRIRVSGLFRNIPAREKHMRSDGTEAHHIERVVRVNALAHLDVGFTLEQDGRQVLALRPATDLRERVLDLFGTESARNLADVDFTYMGYTVKGVVGIPAIARKSPTHQFFFVNDRHVRVTDVSRAVKEAYGTLLAKVLHPFFVLSLDMPPDMVDVNVSPTKSEVRFLEDDRVFISVNQGVKQALEGAELVPEVRPTSRVEAPGAFTVQSPKMQAVFGTEDIDVTPSSTVTDIPLSETGTSDEESGQDEDNAVPMPSLTGKSDERPVSFRPLGQILKTYIIAEGDDERLYIIDQHAAHERVMYERIKSTGADWGGRRQNLLSPVVVRVDPSEKQLLLEEQALFERVGFEVDDFGGNDVVVKSIPGGIPIEDPEQSLQTFLADLGDKKRFETADELHDHILHTIACHSAIRAGETLETNEQVRVLRELSECIMPYTCPHGRPTTVALTRSGLEGLFKRSGF